MSPGDALDFTDLQGFLVGKAQRIADWVFEKEQREFKVFCRRLRWRRTHQRQKMKKLASVVTPRRLGPDAKDAEGRPIDHEEYFRQARRLVEEQKR